MSYQSEKFSVARSNLMLPHHQGEHSSVAHTFHECSLGLDGLDRSILDDYARGLVRDLENMMSVDSLSDPNSEGLYSIKAKTFSVEEKIKLSRIIDELADWFNQYDFDKL